MVAVLKASIGGGTGWDRGGASSKMSSVRSEVLGAVSFLLEL